MNKREITLALNKVSANVEKITSADAKALLKKNNKNRKVNQGRVDTYAQEMLDGNWACNGESIIISDKGTVINGQHRLMAIVQSGISIASVVVRGVKTDDFDTMDQHGKRTNGQILQIEGMKNGANLFASTIRGLHIYKTMGVMRVNTTAFTARQMKMALAKQKKVEESVKYAMSFKRPLVSKSIIAILHNVFCNINNKQGIQFLDAFLTGDVGAELEILKLRNHFIDLHRRGFALGRNREFVGGVIIKSWNAWRKGKVMPKFEYEQGEEFPKAI